MNQKIKQELEDYLEDEINFDKLNLVNNVTKILENYRQHNQLYDYKVVCDNTNNFASDIDKTMMDANGNLKKQAAIWKSYGWNTIEIDGHDFKEILEAYRKIG